MHSLGSRWIESMAKQLLPSLVPSAVRVTGTVYNVHEMNARRVHDCDACERAVVVGAKFTATALMIKMYLELQLGKRRGLKKEAVGHLTHYSLSRCMNLKK
jgi:hypothetical protein